MIYISWRCLVQQKAAKIPAMLENLERSVRGVHMGKSRSLERAELANQIQGFRIPDR